MNILIHARYECEYIPNYIYKLLIIFFSILRFHSQDEHNKLRMFKVRTA